ADQQRADVGGERELERVAVPLADAIGGLGVAARPEGALMQPLDGERIARGFRPDGEGKIGHRLVVKCRNRRVTGRDMRLAFGRAQVYCGLRAGSPTCSRPNREVPSCQPGPAVCKSASTTSAAKRR